MPPTLAGFSVEGLVSQLRPACETPATSNVVNPDITQTRPAARWDLALNVLDLQRQLPASAIDQRALMAQTASRRPGGWPGRET